jgi:hypothetical protein
MKLSSLLEMDLKLAYHDKLNPKLWKLQGEQYILAPKVKTKLMEIAKKFVETLELNGVKIADYVVTGSNANFNWTIQSDLDLHLLVDPEDLARCEACRVKIEDCLQAKKSLWNDRHDITIYDIPVEVYVTTAIEKLVSDSGTYSLTKDAWSKKPEKKKIAVSSVAIKAKMKELTVEIDELIDSKSDDIKKIRDLLDKISRMRAAGLQAEGEHSVENLTFKALRNNGYIDKIRKYSVKAQDDVLSLKESKEITAYHGTDHKIEKFEGVSYFTPQEDAARGYARCKAKTNKKKVAYLYTVTFSFKKVKRYETMQQIGSLSKQSLERLKVEGYDGAYYDGSGTSNVPEYVPLYPEKVKIVKVEEVKL